MKIAIIGSGNIGGTLARRLTALGYDVSIANSRGPASLAELAKETGAKPVSVDDVARGAEIVIVAIPMKAIADLPPGVLEGMAPGAAVVETGNYWPPRDGRVSAIEDDGLTESRWVQTQLGHPVVKAFNGTYWEDLLTRQLPTGDPERMALPVAGDDAVAKQTVRTLIDDLGFDTVDAGGTDDSWRQQPGTPVFTLQAGVDAVTAALAAASPVRPAEFRG